MSLGEDDDQGAGIELETLSGRGWPSITQYSVFLENRVGQLADLVRRFTGTRVRLVGLSIADSVDCCIVRIILSHPEQGREILERAGFAFSETQVLAAELPSGPQSLAVLCGAILQAEVNIHYVYPLMIHPHGRAVVALFVDNLESASTLLNDRGFDLVCEADLAMQ